jgi:hypothetical protein
VGEMEEKSPKRATKVIKADSFRQIRLLSAGKTDNKKR